MKFSDVNLLSFGNTIQMTGVIYAGENKTLLCFFPGEREDFATEVLDDMDLENWKKLMLQLDTLETEVHTKAADGTIAKAILRKSQRTIDGKISWAVYKRDGYACRYCGNNNVPLSVDHLVRWEEGGPSIETNLVSACKKCNKTRGNLSYAEWLKHPRYLQTSTRLSEETRRANEELVATLDRIPRMLHTRSR